MNRPGRTARLSALALAVGLGAAAPDSGPQAVVAGHDQAARLTIAVRVNGQGPFDFLVDTGADRSVISRELAAALQLPAGAPVILHSTGGAEQENTAIIRRMAFGGREALGIEAPLLAASGMGAAGILGLDSLHGQQVTMDFDAGRFLVRPSEYASDERGPFTVVVEGRNRFGQLVLVDADSRNFPILVILDSGAQNTIGNSVLRRKLAQEPPRKGQPVRAAEVISVTGSRTPANLDVIPQIQLGGVLLRNIPIAYADLHTFERFGLSGRPAMLLGMDVLHLFRSVTVDFRRRQAVFVPR